MSMIIRLKGLSVPANDLPRLSAVTQGFPAENLRGLYLLEEGDDDEAHEGAFVDSSGNGQHAALRGDWPQPTKKSYGMQVTDDYGCCIETPVEMTPSFTWVCAARSTHGSTTGGGFPVWIGPANGVGANKTAAHASNHPMVLNAHLGGSSVVPGAWQMYYAPGWPAGVGGGAVKGIPNTNNQALVMSVIGISFDNVSGRLIAKTLNTGARLELSHSSLVGFTSQYASSPPRVCFGVWRQSGFANPSTAELGLTAIYNAAKTESDLDIAMRAAQRRLIDRGVTVSA